MDEFTLYPNPTDTLTFKPFLDKYKKRHGKQSKSVTADSGYGSEENYEYLEMEEMMGYVKYNWFHKEQHKPFKEDAFNQANFYYNRNDDYYVCPMGQHMEPCGQRQTKSDSGYVSVITLYIEHNDVMDVRLEVSARNPKATEPYMSTIN